MKPFLLTLKRQQAPVEIIGECWGGENIAENYQEAPTLNDFLKFAVKSSGDWLLLDREQGVLITAPGFSGAYMDSSQGLVARNVSLLVENRIGKGLSLLDDLSASWWLSREIGDGINSYPVSSPFSEIKTLVGATVVHFNTDSIVYKGYLGCARSDHYSPGLFEDSILSACAQVSRPLCLLFSGGKDCLSIALSLREAGMKSDDLRLVYVDARSISNAMRVKHAEVAARAAGFELEVITPDEGWWAWAGHEGTSKLGKLLSTTIVEPLSPFHCVSPSRDNEVVIDGQNMDAMLSIEMRKPPQEFPRILGGFSQWYIYLFRDVLRNLRYTQGFRRSRFTRSMVFQVERNLKLMYQLFGVYKGYQPAAADKMEIADQLASLQRRLPLGSISIAADCNLPGLRREIEALLELGGARLHEIWFYMYPAMATMLGHGQDMQVYRFPNQGPFSTLWCRETSVKDAFSPKFEVRRFLKRKLGRSYSDAISGWQEAAKQLTEKQGDGNYSELKEFRDLLSWKDSAVLDNLSGHSADRMKADLEKITRIDECRGASEKHRMERKVRFRQGLRYLNIECILRNPSSTTHEAMSMNESEFK